MSFLFQEFHESLKDPDIKLVSFDLFDTLVYRYLFHPSDIFLKLQETESVQSCGLSHFADKRQFFENRARQMRDDKEDISLYEVYSHFVKDAAAFVESELQIEDRYIYANALLDGWIGMAHAAGKRVVITSDFYLSAEELEQIALYKLQNSHLISRVYVSGQEGVLKSTGNLFKRVMAEESVKPEQILHVGDKHKNDHIAPKNLGIKTIYTGLSGSIQKAYEIERAFLTQKPHLLQASRQHVASHSPYPKGAKENIFYEIGSYVFAPALYAFSYWTLELCLARGLTQINCLMREGRIFKKSLESVKNSDKRFADIQINLIYASRASLFFPYLHDDKIDDAHMIYGDMSVGEYYKLCRIKPSSNEVIKYIDEDLRKSKNIFTETHERVYDLVFSDIESRKDEIKQASHTQAELFREHLKQLDYTKESILLDFGGSGSMFGIIDKLLKEEAPSTYILFFEQKKVLQNSLKIESFFPYRDEFKKSCDAILTYAPIIEALFNADEGTTVALKRSGSLVIPVLGRSNKSFFEQFFAFDRGVLEFIAYVNQDEKLHKTASDEERLSYAQIIHRLLVAPTKQEAQTLGTLPFEQDAEGLRHETFLDEISLAYLKKEGIENYFFNLIKHNNRSALKCFWPHGEIARHDDTLLAKMHNPEFFVSPNHNDVSDIIKQLREKEISSLSIFGAGTFLDDLFLEIEELGIKINFIADSNAKNNPRRVYGHNVLHPSELLAHGEKIFVIASGSFYKQMKEQLQFLAKEFSQEIEIITVRDHE
ncbi:HAD-IA family hydrolase [bacterium]|nr:HAD-IA family hydrolase [bacterium]MBU1884206.1 HAD-IA family hydrolase [bacterium]